MPSPITVLMSVHNGMPFVPGAVQSILDQTFSHFEFLILDDASTDGTADYLKSLRDERLRVISLEENVGLTCALNRGLRESRGEFVARQDADDYSQPQRLERQLDFLQKQSQYVLVGSQARLVDGSGRALGKKNLPLDHDGISFAHLFDNAMAHSAVMFRRTGIQDAGGYDENWPASQDYELWSRVSVRGKLANLPERLVTLRILKQSITRTHRRADLIRRVQSMHYERLFGNVATDSDLDLIGLYRSRVVPERLREFRALLNELISKVEALRPGVTRAGDFRRTLALIHERVGYNLLTLARGSAYGELACALKAWPPALLGMPWLRIMALTIMGDGVRRLYGKLAR
jgi:glycosyltransferase involved in cell wall biosynthesis